MHTMKGGDNMSRRRFGEPKSIWFHGQWIKFSSSADREEFIREMNESEKQAHVARTGEYIA
jgi:hypothetical protein